MCVDRVTACALLTICVVLLWLFILVRVMMLFYFPQRMRPRFDPLGPFGSAGYEMCIEWHHNSLLSLSLSLSLSITCECIVFSHMHTLTVVSDLITITFVRRVLLDRSCECWSRRLPLWRCPRTPSLNSNPCVCI